MSFVLLFENSQMFTLLLMQTEVNRIDAQTILAQATTKSAFISHPSLFWLGSGVVLCLLELFLPKAFSQKFRLVPLSMGIISLIIAFSLFRMTRFVAFRWQVAYWMLLSTASIIWIRPMLLKRKKFKVPEATEARTLTEIFPGETGRVLYEGSSWAARCQEWQMSIPVNQTVYVVGQEDNTLIVLPEHLFRA
ncbi:NfeD family protein [Coleofasciculus sp.]|uniref:NfeD family protein n=1 Tax=Coleofasciculus sp. TaxID=3100458 RepID=UPI003A1DC697